MAQSVIFVTNPTELTVIHDSNWNDIDLSSYVTANTVGVIIRIYSSTTTQTSGVRCNGSSSTMTFSVTNGKYRILPTKIDDNNIVEIYSTNSSNHFYVEATLEDGWVMFSEPTVYNPSTSGSWVDVDLSTPFGTDAGNVEGVLMVLHNSGLKASVGIRKNGSTDTVGTASDGQMGFMMCGVDANDVIEEFSYSSTVPNFYLYGYVKKSYGVTFLTNVSTFPSAITSANTWEDVDLTSITSANAIGIFTRKNSDGGTPVSVRNNGSTDTTVQGKEVNNLAIMMRFCDCGSDQVIEGYYASTAYTNYVIVQGYVEEYSGTTTSTTSTTISSTTISTTSSSISTTSSSSSISTTSSSSISTTSSSSSISTTSSSSSLSTTSSSSSISTTSSSSSISSSTTSSSSSISTTSSSSSISTTSSSSSSSTSTTTTTLPLDKLYSHGDEVTLPTTDADLEMAFTYQNYLDVASDDTVRVPQVGYRYGIFLFKDKNTNNTNNIRVEWNGQSTVAPSSVKVVLQIYDRDGGIWEDIQENSAALANTDFTLSGTISSDLDHYYDANFWIACRVYQ